MIKVKDGYAKLINTSYTGDISLVLLSNGGTIGYDVSTNTILATIGSNVASADKLKNKVKIWGLDFDGSGNVSGVLTLGTSYITGNSGANILDSAGEWCYLGGGTSEKGFPTYIDGHTIRLRYGTEHTEGVRISSSGFVGIGTTDPKYKLHVNGNISALRGIFGKVLVNKGYGNNVGDQTIETSDEGMMLYLQYYHNGGINLCQGGGNVGIGTTNPKHKLDVNGNINTSGTVTAVNFTGNLNHTLTFSAGAFSAKTYNNSAAVTVSIPTHTSHLTNNSGFLTAHLSLANYVTLNTALTISGVKTFSTLLKFTAQDTSPFTVTSTTKVANLNADLLDGYHEGSFLRYRDYTTTSGASTLWNQIGIRSYHNALPEGLSGLYNYGQAISFPGNGSRLDIFTNHTGSTDTVNQGLWWRSGWENDKRTWRRIIDSGNIGSQSVSYATSAGNADTVDNEHASAFAHRATWNNLVHSGNEVTFISSAYTGGVWLNYRTASGSCDGNITEYLFGNGKGGSLASISSGAFSGTSSGLRDSNNGTKITASYASGGFSSNPSWLCAWNGYHITYVSPSVLSVNYASSAGSVAWANVTGKPSFFSGNYNDLTNKPTIPSVGNGTVTIKQAGTTKGSFTMNQSGNTTINLTDNNTTYSFTNNNPTLSWGTKSTIGTVGGVALTVTMPANPNTNTWRGITNSYSGTDSTISLSQKGGNALYNALVNGYASSAGSVPWSGVTGKPSFFSGNYNDLTNKPTIPSVGNGTVNIYLSGTYRGSFSMNQSGNTTINLTDNNTWRSITNSYSGVDTTISLSQKGANDLYKALSGYKSTTASRNTSNTTAGTLLIRQWGPFVNICGRITLKYTNTNTAYVAFTVPSTIGAPVADVGFHITYYGTGSNDDRGCLLYAKARSRTFYFTYNELNNTPSVYINICYFTETSTFTLTKI